MEGQYLANKGELEVIMGGRRYTTTNYFNAWDSNTICDFTGFKVKKSGVIRQWEGWYGIPEAWRPRQPQDFPVVPIKQKIYKNVRNEQVFPSEEAQTFPPIV